jgi:hypothetical protein
MENSKSYIVILAKVIASEEVEILTTPQPSTSKLEISLDADLMRKLKTKADTANKTPSEVVAELLREKLRQ